MPRGRRGRDWSQLYPELLQKIATELTLISDYARFRAVCVPWRSATSPTNLPPQLPWLITPAYSNKEIRYYGTLVGTRTGFRPLHLPEFQSKNIDGSSHGWLLTVDLSSLSAFFLNPLTRAQVCLPPFPTSLYKDNPAYYCGRIVSTSSSDWMVMVHFYETPAVFFCQPGDGTWTEIGRMAGFMDIYQFIYYKGRVFIIGITDRTTTIIFDAISLAQVSELPMNWMPDDYIHALVPNGYLHYLVQSSSEELLLVVCCVDRETRFRFEVYKLDESKKPQWLRVRNIGDTMLFADEFNALPLVATGFSGFRRNCIYFEPDCGILCIFDIGNDRVKQFLSFRDSTKILRAFGTWMIPSLC